MKVVRVLVYTFADAKTARRQFQDSLMPVSGTIERGGLKLTTKTTYVDPNFPCLECGKQGDTELSLLCSACEEKLMKAGEKGEEG